jgi:hypothetical protein
MAAVAGGQNFDELLKRLAKVKPLPGSSADASGFVTQQMSTGLDLRDSVINSFRNSGGLDYQQIRDVAAGGSPVTSGPRGLLASTLNSAPAKAVLNGLNTIGVPMRLVNSTLKEVKDALDSDPNTKAGWNDYWKQVKDPTFGFGRVVPMKGWGGRLIGFAGDLITDPINWLTLGSAGALRTAGNLGAQGAFRAGVRESLEASGRLSAGAVGKTSLRETLGVRTLAGADGRFALAEEVRRLGGTASEVAGVAARGKLAVPKDIAEVMGLGKSGIYVAGTKVRLPGSGLLSEMTEKTLTKMRLGVLRSGVGDILQRAFTRRGVAADTKRFRMLLSKGMLPDDEVQLATMLLNSDTRFRAAANIARESTKRRVIDYAADADVDATRNTVYRVMENPDGVVASEAERRAAEKIRNFFMTELDFANKRFKAVDDGYIPRSLNNFLPHVLSDAAKAEFDKAYANPALEQVLTYLKVNPLEAQGSFKHRFITADQEFLGVPGSVHKGTIDGINAVTREKLGFDLFETDVIRMMTKYADTIGGAAGSAEMMRLMKESRFLLDARRVAAIDPQWMLDAKNGLAVVTKSLHDEGGALVDSVESVIGRMEKSFDDGALGQMVGRETAAAQKELNEIGKGLGKPVKNFIDEPITFVDFEGNTYRPSDMNLLLRVDAERQALIDAVNKFNLKQAEFSALFAPDGGGEMNMIHQILTSEHKRLTDAFDAAQAKLFALRQGIAEGKETTETLQALRVQSKEALKAAREATKKYSGTLRDYEFWADDFGTWMQESLKRVGQLREDITRDPVTGNILEKSLIPVRGRSLVPEDVSSETKEVLTRIIDAEERKILPPGMGLNENWLSQTFGNNSDPSLSKQLLIETAPQLVGQPARINQITSQSVTQSVIRGLTSADNIEQLSDSFGWMTIRLLKEAERRGGVEAREALARQLAEGVGGIGQMWQRAKKQVDILDSVYDTISLVARRKPTAAIKEFGKQAVDVSEQIAALTRQIDSANEKILELSKSTSGNIGLAAREMLSDLDDFAASTFRTADTITQESLDEYIARVDAVFDGFVEQGIVREEEIFNLRAVATFQLRQGFVTGDVNRNTLNEYRNILNDELGTHIDGFMLKNRKTANQRSMAEIGGLQKTIRENQQKIDKLLKSDSGDNDYVKYTVAALSGDLRTQVSAVAETLQEYQIFNEAYFWFSAFQNLAPAGVVIPETVWSHLLASTAETQYDAIQQGLDDAMRARELAFEMWNGSISKLPKPEQANALALAVESLPMEDRRLMNRFFGTLISGQEYKEISDLDRVVRQDPRYTQLLNEIADVVTGRATRAGSLAPGVVGGLGAAGREAAPQAVTSGRVNASLLIADIRNESSLKKVRGLLTTTHKRTGARFGDGSLVQKKWLTQKEAEDFLVRLQDLEVDARLRVKEITAMVKENSKSKNKRQMQAEIRGDEFGLSGLFRAATQSRANGTGARVSEWFARAIGGGKTAEEAKALGSRVYTGVGGKYRTTGTFAINQYGNSGDIIMGGTFANVTGDIEKPLARQYKYITESESHYGQAYDRLAKRKTALRALMRDSTVSEEIAVGRLPDGTLIDERGNAIVGRVDTEGVLGPMSYIIALEGQLDEYRQALKQFGIDDMEFKKIKALEDGAFKVKSRATAAEKEIARLQQEDYELFKASRDPQQVAYIQAILRGEYDEPQPANLHPKVRDAVQGLIESRRTQEKIESTRGYLSSIDRRSLHKFIKHLAGYNLGHNTDTGMGGLRELSSRVVNPNAPQKRLYTSVEFANLKKFAQRIAEQQINTPEGFIKGTPDFILVKATRAPFVPEEAAQIIASRRNDYIFIKDNFRFTDEMLAAFLSANKNANLPENQLALVRRAIDDRTVDIWKADTTAPLRYGDAFDPEETLAVLTITSTGDTRIFNGTDVFGYSAPVRDTTTFPTMEIDGVTIPITFDELEWDQLFAKPMDVRQVRNKLAAKEAERKKLWSTTFGTNEKKMAKLDKLDAEIEDLKIQIVRNDANKQMEMVRRARAMRNYFDQPDVKKKLGLKADASPEKTFDQWADMNAKNMSIRDTPQFVEDRVKELDNAWDSSYEAKVISEHRAASTKAKNSAMTLQTALAGGRAAWLADKVNAIEIARQRSLEKAGQSVEEALKRLERFAVQIVSRESSVASEIAAQKLNVKVESLAELLRDPAFRPGALNQVMTEYDKAINEIVKKSGLIESDLFGPSGLLRSVTGEEIVTGQVQNVHAEKIMDALDARAKVIRESIEKGLRKPASAAAAQAERAGAAAREGNVQLYGAELYDRTIRSEVAANTVQLKNWERAVKEAQTAAELTEKELRQFEAAVLSGKEPKAKSLGYVREYYRAKKNAQRAAEGARQASDALEASMARFDSAMSAFQNRGVTRLRATEAYSRAQNLKKLRNSMDASIKKMKDDKILNTEFDEFGDSIERLFEELNKMAKFGDEIDEISALRGVLVQYQEQRADWLIRYQQQADTRARIKVVEDASKTIKDLGPLAYLNPVLTETNAFTLVNKLEKGFVQFGEQFPNLMADPRVMEIFENAHRLRDPAFARAAQRFMGPYTKFFKAWAVATPGFHVRNSFSNGFMLFAAGGRPDSLYRGLLAFRALKEAIDKGESFETHVAKLSAEEQVRVRGAYFAMMGSGGGLMSDVDLSTGSRLYANKFTKKLQKLGIAADNHARFMLAYDGMDNGMDALTAAARVKRFMVDYEDTSVADAYMRQIMPFWMWTSRNLPLQIQNIFLNPKAYRFYTAMSNNFRDEDETNKLPKYLREVGAFALPGGKTYFSPDLPFSRVGQQIEQIQSPRRLAADVNPLLRVPLEVMLSNKKFYSDIPFKEGLQKADGPVANLASYLAQPFGQGGTMKDGGRGVTDKAMYSLMNYIPIAGQFERLVPSTETYQSRPGSTRLAQYFGVPVREMTDQMKQQELQRRLYEINALRRQQGQQ